jgi:DNA-binding CsgD family transcriptional regulator
VSGGVDKNSSSAEMLFWYTILLLAIIYIGLHLLAYSSSTDKDANSSNQNSKQTTVVPQKIVTVIKEFIVDDESIREYFDNNKTVKLIDRDIATRVDNIHKEIDSSLDTLFAPIYGRVDQFLDFHYSVVGEYTELGLAATGKIEESIKDRLFGSEFATLLKETNSNIDQKFLSEINLHRGLLDSQATNYIDIKLNSDTLTLFRRDINSSIATQRGKIIALLSIGVGYKAIVAILSTKIATKLSSKLMIKGAIKASSKLSAVGTGLVAGTICGPGALICSPLFATAAWFGSDAILISGDEYLHRSSFKQEIIRSLNEQKSIIKREYKRIYADRFCKESKSMIDGYRRLPIQKRIRRKVREYIDKPE